MKPLMTNGCTSLTQALEEVVPLNGVKEEADPSVVVDGIVNGLVFFIVEGEKKFAMLDVRMTERRSVSTPQNEKVVHGPHQGFVEDIRANVNLVRNIARTPDLCTKFIPIGGDNGLRGALLYREGMVDPKLLAKVKQKLLEAQRHKGFVLGEYSVARIFERRKYSLFPQALQTERPDRTAAFVMQGHIALICDGAPYALVVPITFFGLVHTSEDHSLPTPCRGNDRAPGAHPGDDDHSADAGAVYRLGHLSSRGLADGIYDLYSDAAQDGRAAGGGGDRADHHPIRAGARGFDSRAGRH